MAVDYENMTDEDYFACLKLMFNTEGWEVLMVELQEQAISINDVQMCKDTDELRYKQGQLNILGKILRLEETLRRTEEDAEDEQ